MAARLLLALALFCFALALLGTAVMEGSKLHAFFGSLAMFWAGYAYRSAWHA
jgi:hypothetical protein